MSEYDVLKQITPGIGDSNTVLFVRGFHSHDYLRRRLRCQPGLPNQTPWYRGLTDHGFRGQLLSFNWQPASFHTDCFSSAARDDRVHNAACNLWDCLLDDGFAASENISLIGYSMGGQIVQYLLSEARRQGVVFKRAYLFGATASRCARWSRLSDAVSERIYNFYSDEDEVLERYYPRSVGLSGLYTVYDGICDIDCSRFVTSHGEWCDSLPQCLRKARVVATRI